MSVMNYVNMTSEALIAELLERDKQCMILRRALRENGAAFAAYGDHVRQAGCYTLAEGEQE